MKTHIAILILLISGACASMKKITDFTTFSETLYKLQKTKKGCSFYPEKSFENRNKLGDKFNFINYKADTVYLLEAYSIETGILYNAIWTRNGKVEYKAQAFKVEIDSSLFIKRLYKMIENWDIETIRKEDKEHGNLFGGLMMIGSKMVLYEGDAKLDCITFKEFFDLQKDEFSGPLYK